MLCLYSARQYYNKHNFMTKLLLASLNNWRIVELPNSQFTFLQQNLSNKKAQSRPHLQMPQFEISHKLV